MTSPGDFQRVRELFQAALDVPPDARLAFVKQRADDPLVFDEVASLLAAYPEAVFEVAAGDEGAFLDVDTPDALAAVRAGLAPAQ